MKDEKEARLGEWDFDGSCAPPESGGGGAFSGQETFTLGCFPWVQRGKAPGKGLKKGKVAHRVRGHVSEPGEAYRAARAWCAERNAETFGGGANPQA